MTIIKGILSIPVRFFLVGILDDDEDGMPDIYEVTEAQFLEAKGPISYERNNVFENGCNQICLTKDTL